MRIVIIVNTDMSSIKQVKEICSWADIIIAADGGANVAYNAGISVDYVIGDLDSIKDSVLEHYRGSTAKIDRYPCEKDYTDTELCLIKAIELKATEIIYLGGIGNRIDHSIGNIHLLYKTMEMGIKACIKSQTADVYICKDHLKITGMISDTVSILPLYKPVRGITLKGFKYALDDATFEFGDVFGVCNKLISKEAYINIKEGCLIVIKQYNI